MSLSEVQLTDAAITSQDDSGETGPVVTTSSDQQTDNGIGSDATALSDVQLIMEVVADTTGASEEKPTADDGDMENSLVSQSNDDGKRSTPEKADSDVSAQCNRMVTPKARGGRSYQESRRSKKPVVEKSKSVSGSSKYERTCELVDAHGLDARCLEQKGKGDVQDAGMQHEESLKHAKDSLCHPTCDGDQPAVVNVIIDDHDMQKRYDLMIDS